MENIPSSKILKIILAGLDNAGKTSMLVVLKRMYQFEEEVHSLQPTIRIEHYRRNFLGYLIDFNDMGGQQKYRERYLERKLYFDQTDCLIYLIDITDTQRIPESITYLGKLLVVLKEVQYSLNKEILICFTKMDFGNVFTEKPEYIINLANARKEILAKYPEFKFDFYSSSIYNVYSIVKMISKGLMGSIPAYQDLRNSLESFAEEYDFSQVLLFDYSGLIISEVKRSISVKSKQVYSPTDLDRLVSRNLEYFRKVQENEDPTFEFFQQQEQEFINFGYRFYITHGQDKTAYYVSLVIHEENPKKLDWNTEDLVGKLRIYLEKMK